MRRLALVIAIGAVWLILAAVPALADGGPHVMTQNNGSLGINADGCAGCHRAHTAQGPFLINAADETALCTTCHGAAGAGATTDVMSGIQYRLVGAGAPRPRRPPGRRLRHGRDRLRRTLRGCSSPTTSHPRTTSGPRCRSGSTAAAPSTRRP